MENNYSSLQVLGVKELQGVLHISKDRAYALMRSKDFPSMRIGKKYYVTMENLEKWLQDYTNRTFKFY